MAEKTSTAFRPVRGKEVDILAKGYNEGYIYFATDTGNIFIDAKGVDKIPMGGRGAALLYAKGPAVQNSDNDYYSIPVDSLEDPDAAVKEGDLIINTDGAFYKVDEVLTDFVSCVRIAVSGTGTGGGTDEGGSTVVTVRGRLTVAYNTEVDILNGSNCTFSVTATSAVEDGEPIDDSLKLSIAYYVAGSTIPYYTDAMMISHGQTITYDATEYLRNSTETSISFAISGSASNKFYSNGKVERTVSTHNLNVEWVDSQFSNIKYFTSTIGTSVRFSTGAKRILDIFFDDSLVFTKTYGASDTTSSAAPTISADSPIYDLNGNSTGTTLGALYSHGRHKISAVMSLAKADGRRGSSTGVITKEIALYLDEGFPLIWFGDMNSVYYEFDNPLIPIRVYDPHSDANGVKVYLFADGADVLDGEYYTINNDANHYLYWTLTDLAAGQNITYQVRVGEDDFETWETVPDFKVLEDPRNMGIATQAMAINFDSRGRSNAESSKRRSIIQLGQNKVAELSGFNWYNNGWIMDDNNTTCLRISNGASVSIPIGAMSFAGNTPSRTIEMRMRIRNVQNYDKLITNYTRYCVSSDPNVVISSTTDKNWKDDEVFAAFLAQKATGISSYDAYLTKELPKLRAVDSSIPTYDELGFSSIYRDYDLATAMVKYIANESNPTSEAAICLGPQDGYFSNGTNAVTVDYVEDDIINLTIVYDNGSGSNALGNNKLMKFYLNGMLTSIARSTLTSSWAINADNLIINSAGCDIDLYKFRVYNRALGLNEVLKNVAYDDKDTTSWDLSELYTANQTIDEDYQFSFNKMITYNKNNPDNAIMPYIIFTTDDTDNTTKGKLPWRKDTPVTADMEFVNPALDRAYAKGELSQLADDAGVEVQDYYLHHCPSWIAEGVSMSVQGTSSEFYPRRNYKAKTKVSVPVVDDNGATSTDEFGDVKTESVYTMRCHKGPFASSYEDGSSKSQKFFYYDNNTVGTNKFTLKVDYMESSGSYNMGLANLVNNAYSHHPLRDYNSANAFVTGHAGESVEEVQTTFDATKASQYSYISHKGEWKTTTADNKNLRGPITAEQFAAGPVATAAAGKVLTSENLDDAFAAAECAFKTKEELAEHINKWYIYSSGEVEYSKTTVGNLQDYRTSVQGFPTLAFYQTKSMKKANLEPLFIGRYNMLLDKGSKEAYGFDIGGTVLQNYIEDKPVVGDIAECWEFENNSRGFCSFRDPWNRRELSFKAPEGATNALTSAGAPIIADYFEYRYNANDDYIDLLYDMKTSFENPNTVKKLQAQFGADNISDIASGRQMLLKLYQNWEKACKWVWSTATDAVIDGQPVPKLGEYSKITLYEALFEENKYYIENPSRVGEYVLAGQLDPLLSYYVKNDGNIYTGIKLTNDENLVYEPGKYYLSQNNNFVLAEDEYDGSETYYQLIEDTSQIDEMWKLASPVTYGGTVYEYDTQEYRLAKFKNELEKHFNLEYLATYFVITEVLECYDSRGKNAMFASWGPQEENGDYIWYPIFYDLDTQLGINNTGIPSFQYNIDATEDGTFSTNDSVLWNNFYALYKNIIIDKYEQLTGVPSDNFGGKLSNAPFVDVDTIEAWYSCNPQYTGSYSMKGLRPLLALNLDEQYKYISITNPKVGYPYQNGEITQDTSNTYFYALQGNRSMSRRQFLTNRLNYIDSWFAVGNYKRGGANRIRSRISANNRENTSDWWIEGTATNGSAVETNVPYYRLDGNKTAISENYSIDKTHLFDGEYWINMTPVRNMYVTVGTDAANFDPIKFSGTPVRFETDDLREGVKASGNYREQLYYIYGLDQMKSLGDLSRLYFQEFELSGKAAKMIDLKLGYDGLDEGGRSYKNSGVNDWTIPAAAGTLTGGMPLLKEVNLCNITFKNNNNTFDFSSCEKLENFRNTGSNITQVTFADGVALDTLYLTSSTTALKLVEARKLTDLITNYEAPIADEDGNLIATPGLYIAGLTDGNKQTLITTFDIQGGNLGYNSYKLLELYLEACHESGPATERKINVTDVQWSPYVKITDAAQVHEDNAQYFIDNGHFGLTEYKTSDYTPVSWQQYINNGMMYEYDPTIEVLDIKDDSLFTTLIDTDAYLNTSDTNNAIPNITGFVYIDNEVEKDEEEIQENLAKNFPGVTFFFKKVNKGYSARFVVKVGNVETLIGTDKISKSRLEANPTLFFTNPLNRTESAFSSSKINALKPTQDFLGWGTENTRIGLVETYDEVWQNSLGNSPIHSWDTLSIVDSNVYDYTFYAVFEDHSWDINFWIIGDNGEQILAHNYSAVHGKTLTDPGILLMRDESNLTSTKRYKFLGYSRKINGNNIVDNVNAASPVDLSSFKATANYNFYALFCEESVYDSVTDLSYFNITQQAFLDPHDEKYSIESGYSLMLKTGVTLKGKITLPTTYNGLPIVSVGGFKGQRGITHIYFDNVVNSKIRQLSTAAFEDCTSLQFFEYPSSLRVISDNAFSLLGGSLEYFDLSKSPLYHIGTRGFLNSFYSDEPINIHIPGTVVYVGSFGLANNNFASVEALQFGGPNDPTQISTLGTGSQLTINGGQSTPTIGKLIVYSNNGQMPSIINTAISSGRIYVSADREVIQA